MKRRFCFRFDVDNENCIRNGVPRLLGLGKELGAQFTFFVNMGQPAKRTAYFFKQIGKKGAEMPKLSNVEKLGKLNFLKTALLNPSAGAANKGIIQKIGDSGHEIGLHGGKNHGDWMRNALKWDRKKIEGEIGWGLHMLEEACAGKPNGFTSPGFVSNERIQQALKGMGFKYCSDTYGEKEKITEVASGLKNIPVNIAGEGGVGFIEAMRAVGKKDKEAVEEFEKKLLGKSFGIAYDHPGYAAVKELALVEKLLLSAEKNGFRICTMQEIARKATV